MRSVSRGAQDRGRRAAGSRGEEVTVVHTGERQAGQGGVQWGAFQQRVYASGVSFTQSVSRTWPHSHLSSPRCTWARRFLEVFLDLGTV